MSQCVSNATVQIS